MRDTERRSASRARSTAVGPRDSLPSDALVDTLHDPLAVQADTGVDAEPAEAKRAAARGVTGPSMPLPHGAAIQKSFGKHDLSSVKAHVGGEASTAASALGATAFATGDHVAFDGSPDVHTAAHEAAHVVQQRAGVSLYGGVGRAGDPWEQQADRAADAVVAGRSAEGILGAGGSGGGPALQLRGNKSARKYSTPDWNGLVTSRAHVMDGEVNDSDEAVGLHAYSNGSLPGSVTLLETVGSENSVHWIWWTKGKAKTKDKAKWSSMFPKNLTEGMVTAVLQKSTEQVSPTVDCAALGLPYGGSITVGTAGDTMFPSKKTPAETRRQTVSGYTITNREKN